MGTNFKRYEATAPVVIGITNQNIINNFRKGADGEIHLPSLRTLAKMIYNEHEFIDLYDFEVEVT